MIINQIFSNFVLDETLSFNTNELKTEILQRKETTPNRQSSNIGGWQSDDVSISMIFPELEKEILKSALVAMSYLGLKNINPLIYNSWININHKHDYNDRHMHKNSILSGIFYVSANENSGRLVFHSPNDKLSFFISKEIIEDYNFVNSGTWYYDPSPNMMLIFPSWLEHQVMPNLSDEPRISIAFNIGF